MKIVVLLTALFAIAIAEELTIENCKCWAQHEAVVTPEGIKCAGILLKIYRACNTPEPPRCVCANNEDGAVIGNARGTFCINKEKKEWPCENISEWDAYNGECKLSQNC